MTSLANRTEEEDERLVETLEGKTDAELLGALLLLHGLARDGVAELIETGDMSVNVPVVLHDEGIVMVEAFARLCPVAMDDAAAWLAEYGDAMPLSVSDTSHEDDADA
jgi:hypothetical protein